MHWPRQSLLECISEGKHDEGVLQPKIQENQ